MPEKTTQEYLESKAQKELTGDEHIALAIYTFASVVEDAVEEFFSDGDEDDPDDGEE